MNVLIVEDDVLVAEHVDHALAADGLKPVVSASGAEGIALATLYDYDAIVVDLAVRDLAGLAVVKAIRRKRGAETVPILALSLRGVHERVAALQAGADDCLAKPFHKDELTARLKAVVRRRHGHASSLIEIGPLTIDLDRFIAKVQSAKLALTPKEFEILAALALRRDQVVGRQQLFNAMYGNEPSEVPDIKIIDVFVCKIRKRLAEAGAPGLIETVWARGYTMRARAAASVAA
jgi:two-component system, cell cycle response regulator CtrA